MKINLNNYEGKFESMMISSRTHIHITSIIELYSTDVSVIYLCCLVNNRFHLGFIIINEVFIDMRATGNLINSETMYCEIDILKVLDNVAVIKNRNESINFLSARKNINQFFPQVIRYMRHHSQSL